MGDTARMYRCVVAKSVDNSTKDFHHGDHGVHRVLKSLCVLRGNQVSNGRVLSGAVRFALARSYSS